MGFIVCSCGWRKEAPTCSEAHDIVKTLAFRCPVCLFTGLFRYANE